MLISNLESLDTKDLYYCKSINLKRFLCEHKDISFIDKTFNKETQRCTWIFVKSKDLDEALDEWSQNKKDGKLLFPSK